MDESEITTEKLEITARLDTIYEQIKPTQLPSQVATSTSINYLRNETDYGK